MTESTQWADVEFADIDLGDARLDNRARKIIEQFSAKPSSSIPQTYNGWGETIATYRFLENEAVAWRDKVRQQLWAQEAALPAGRGTVVKATCVIAREIDPPEGAEAVEWRLLTNCSATTLDEVIELIDPSIHVISSTRTKFAAPIC